MPSLPLFEEPPAAVHRLAFERWLQQQSAVGSLRQPSSIEVYRDMWGSFTAWCLGQSPAVSLASLDVRDLQAFQDLERLLGIRNNAAHPGTATPGRLDVQHFANKLAERVFATIK